jgi:hypothetical protein
MQSDANARALSAGRGMSHFYGTSIFNVLREHDARFRKQVPAMGEEILSVPTDDLVSDLVETFGLRVPTIYPDRAEVIERGEGGSPGSVRVVIAVPFDGQPDLFGPQPSSHQLVQFEGAVKDSELRFTISQQNASKESIRAALDRQVALYEKELAQLRQDLRHFNEGLPGEASELVEARKSQLLEAREVLASLEFPVRKREDAVIPVPVTRRVNITRATVQSTAGFTAEPEVSQRDYESILASTRSMGIVMERAPGTFSDLAEEGIRDFFLALLNFGFRGDAMGEVFNGEGKTDILIRVDEKNVFIAECKVWYNPKRFSDEALDQLLKNVGWRDTKCAILLFVHDRAVSDVIDTVDGLIRAHGCFKREDVGAEGELERRYVLHWPGDERRELRVALQVFAVPATTPTRTKRRVVKQ